MKLLILLIAAQAAFASLNSLQMAMATCQVDKVKQLLAGGADPNANDRQGKPIVGWVASNQRCTDDTALATLKVLAEHGARFEYHLGSTDFLTMFANRRLPNALAFLVTKKESGDPSQALHAISRSGDLSSMRVLLNAGADPLVGVALSSALFDAVSEGHADEVREMLVHIKDKQVEKVFSAYKFAKKKGDEKVAQVFLDAGVKPPPEPEPLKIRCQRQALTLELEKLTFALKIERGCKLVQECADQVLIDCNSAADGPAYYIDKKAGTVLATCGGACMGGHCTNCPPKGWTCECKL